MAEPELPSDGTGRGIDMKLVAAGDGSVGKTCLLMSYAYNRFPQEYVPTIFDTYTVEVIVNAQLVNRKYG